MSEVMIKEQPTMKILPSGTIEWRLSNGASHREDGPAIIDPNGDKIWAYNGKMHREDGPALDFASGTKQWFFHGKRHRTDGPAIDWNGVKEWWIDGKLIDCKTQEEFERLMRLKAFW